MGFVATGEIPRKVRANPRGYMNRRVNEILNVYGIGYPNEELTGAVVQSSGNGHDDVILNNCLL